MISEIIHTRAFKWFLALMLIVMFLVSYAGAGKVYIKDTTTHGNALTDKEKIDYEQITVTYERGMPEDLLEQCKAAVEKFPANVIQQFIYDDWKINVVSEIELPENTNISIEVDNTADVIGVTDYQTKTITVLCNDRQPTVTIPLAHELGHYCDSYYGTRNFADDDYYLDPPDIYLVSFTKEFTELYTENRDKYIEFEKSGLKMTEENELDFKYPVSNHVEFFACAYKDYLMHPEYVKDYYKDIYSYFQRMESGIPANFD